MKKNNLHSQSLDLLRFPLAVVIVIIHIFSTSGFRVQGTVISFENMPILLEINHFIDGFLRGQSVPIYFFISGFVFFLGIKLTKEKYLQKLKNRIKTLLIPYMIWNAIAALSFLLLFLPFFSSLVPNIHKIQLDFSLPAILGVFWDCTKGIFIHPITINEAATFPIFPQNIPLWFIRDLMIVILCTPLLYWLLQRTYHYFVLVLGILWFTLAYWDLGHINQLLTAFFFFSWGAYMSVNKKDMIHEFSRFFKSSLILYPLLALLFVVSVHCLPIATDTIKRLNIFVGLYFAYNISAWLLKHKVCKVSRFLAASSFFVYITHALICDKFLKLFFILFHPVTELEITFIYLLTVVITISSLLFIFFLLRRYLPSFLNVIAGRK